MRRNTRLLWAACAVLLLGSDFRGCGGGAPEGAPLDAGRPLPVRTGPCLVDGDCASEDMCVLLVCRAGRCVEEGPPFDTDGDRVAPPPCGDDCDDRNASTFPGAAETCNGIDDDCDGVVDEGAPGARAFDGPRLDLARLVALPSGWAFVGLSAEGDLVAQVVAASGELREPSVVATAMELGDVVDVAAHGGGRQVLVILARGPAGPPLRLVLDLVGESLVATGRPTEVGEAGAERVAVTLFGGSEWVAWDTTSQRFLLRSSDASTRTLDRGDGFTRPTLATDGANLAVADGDRVVRFYGADGGEVAAQEMSGPFAASPLASGEGVVYVAYRDAFDHLIAQVSTTTVGSGVTAPSGSREDDVTLARTEEHVLFLRADAREARATLLSLDLRAFVASFLRTQITPHDGTPRRVTTATSGMGLSAIGTAFAGQTGLGVLRCRD